MINLILQISAVVGAVLALWGLLYGAILWFQKQEKQSKDIAALQKKHKADIEAMRQEESADIQAIKDELCVLDYAMLATLDGLKQLNCNGNVTRAHETLEKHLNKQAHRQA